MRERHAKNRSHPRPPAPIRRRIEATAGGFRLFVTGTDTGVGKTEAACALLSVLAEAGLNPAAFKPYESGCENLASPSDAIALRQAARCEDDLNKICPHRFRLPLAPGAAALRLGQRPSFTKTLRAFASFGGRPLIAEGAGGLRVPIDSKRDMLDLMVALNLPVLLVARSGLGTLNHIALSVDAIRSRGLAIVAVLLSRGPTRDPSELDNPKLIARRNRVLVLGPVPFERNRAKRRAAFRSALRPLLRARK